MGSLDNKNRLLEIKAVVSDGHIGKRRIYTNLLHHSGIQQVSEAKSRKDLIRQLKETNPQLLILGGVDSEDTIADDEILAVIAEARSSVPGIKILADIHGSNISGRQEPQLREAGVDDVIGIPFTIEAMKAKVHSLFNITE